MLIQLPEGRESTAEWLTHLPAEETALLLEALREFVARVTAVCTTPSCAMATLSATHAQNVDRIQAERDAATACFSQIVQHGVAAPRVPADDGLTDRVYELLRDWRTQKGRHARLEDVLRALPNQQANAVRTDPLPYHTAIDRLKSENYRKRQKRNAA